MSNKGEILYQGHASLRITTPEGQVIYIDPYAGSGYEPEADLILVTHHHFDHDNVSLPSRKQSTIVLDPADFRNGEEYLKKQVGNISIEAVEAYNHHHSKEECVGYLLDIDGTVIYVPGDTGLTEQMKTFKDRSIDIAFLPVDGIYTMTPDEARECAEWIQAKTIIPYHTKVGALFDESQARKLDLDNVLVVADGQTIEF